MRWLVIGCAVILVLSASACSMVGSSSINITDAKIVTAIDEKLMPVQVTDRFPKNTAKIVCWFQWKDAKIDTQVIAKWHYITDDIHILDYSFIIPKKEGTGSIVLAMPDGKNLPSGEYKVDLILGKRVLKRLIFRIE